MSILIDKAIEYIEAKNANYLAKEGQVVFFTSLTGRKSDQIWVKMTMTETIRIIRATRLTTDCDLREHHVLAAFQELGRVFEYGAKSRHKVAEGVFNYYAYSDSSLANQTATHLVDAFSMRGLRALISGQVFNLYQDTLNKLGEGVSSRSRDVLLSVIAGAGYEHKTGSRRVLHGGTKTNVFMLPNAKPSQIINLSDISDQIIQQVYGELK